MTKPTLKNALARAMILQLRLEELSSSTRRSPRVIKAGLMLHLDEDIKSIKRIVEDLSSVLGEDDA